MTSDRINARLPEPLAQHVQRVVGSHGLYETPSEYVRSLIRQDMENEKYRILSEIVEGFGDVAAGRYLPSTGDWEKDKARFAAKEAQGWQ